MDGIEKWESAGWDADFDQTAKDKKSIRRRVIDDDAMEVATEEILELDAANIRRLCPEPKPGQRYVIVTEKSMNAVSFIKATLERGGDFFVFEGSGNISDNARIEVYNYENNRTVYDFHVRWMRRVFEGKGKGGGEWS